MAIDNHGSYDSYYRLIANSRCTARQGALGLDEGSGQSQPAREVRSRSCFVCCSDGTDPIRKKQPSEMGAGSGQDGEKEPVFTRVIKNGGSW